MSAPSILVAARELARVMVFAALGYAAGSLLAGCAGSQTAGYPTPEVAAGYDLRVTDCAVTGQSRAEIDACRAEAAAAYCANYPAMAMCPLDGGAQ